MRIIFHDGVISQFEGYDALTELDWDAYRAKYGDIRRLDRILEAEGDTTNRYRLSKQADVLMLFYLLSPADITGLLTRLGYPPEPDLIRRTIAYYLPRTSHGSTLSALVHAWILARTDGDSGWRLFLETLQGDIEDIQHGTTPEGIHLGAMAGTSTWYSAASAAWNPMETPCTSTPGSLPGSPGSASRCATAATGASTSTPSRNVCGSGCGPAWPPLSR